MDCKVIGWDFSKGRPITSFSLTPTAEAPSSSQNLNPPFVNSLSFSSDGHTLYAASGNGEVVVYDARQKEEIRRVLGHTHSAMHV